MNETQSTRRWLWRALSKTLLIPLLLAGLGLAALYLLIHHLMYTQQVAMMGREAGNLLNQVVEREARLLEADMENWERQVVLLADETRRALETPVSTPRLIASAERHRRTPDGIYYAPVDDGAAASFYSALTPAVRRDYPKVARLARLDPFMRQLVENDPRVGQAYINTFDSYNRLWPWFDTRATYDDQLDIPAHGFYYLADARHNPERVPVWTDAYLDPAGAGRMISVIAPVYRDGFLEGVAGLDITLDELLTRLLDVALPWPGYAMLLGRDGTLLAVPPAGQRDFDIKTGRSASMPEASRIDLARLGGDAGLDDVLAEASGQRHLTLHDQPRLMAWHELPGVDWTLLAIVDESAAFATGGMLARSLRLLGLWMLGGLALFCVLVYLLLRRRIRRLAVRLTRPLRELEGMAADLGAHRPLREPGFKLSEFATVAGALRDADREREHALAALAEKSERLNLAMDACGSAVWEYDVPGDRLHLPENVFHMLGLEPTPTISLAAFTRLIHPDDLPGFEWRRRRVIDGKLSTAELELRLHLADGRWVWVLSRGRVTRRNEQGEALQALGVVVNIHRRKRATDELTKARDEARRVRRVQSRLFSRVSHELRTPLGAILGFGELLQGRRDACSDDQERQYLVEMTRAASRLDDLLEDVLQLASLESGELAVECSPQSARRCLQRSVGSLMPRASKAGITLEIDDASGECWLLADRQRLDQVVQNLVDNAIKYNHRGGWVRLAAREVGEQVCLEVADSGQGIAEERRAELFTPFARLGMEHSDIRGSGLGLTLCQELMWRMQGRIEVASQAGQGSRFRLWLPWVDVGDRRTEVARALPPEASLERPLALLLVGQDDALRLRLEILAERLPKLELFSTRRHARALRLINEQRPRLLLICADTLDAHQAHKLLAYGRRMGGHNAVKGYWIGDTTLPPGFYRRWSQPLPVAELWQALKAADVFTGDVP